MHLAGKFSESLFENEQRLFKLNSDKFSNLLEFHQLLRDSIYQIIHLNLSEQTISDSSEIFDKFLFRMTTRIISISNLTLRSALIGYPYDAFSLVRTMQEIVRVTTYFYLERSELQLYLDGKLNVQKIMGKLEKYISQGGKSNAHKTWINLSNFSHATSSHLKIFSEDDFQNKRIPFLVNNEGGIEGVLSESLAILYTQYWLFRIYFKQVFAIPEEVRTYDTLIFLPSKLNALLHHENSSVSKEIYDALYNE